MSTHNRDRMRRKADEVIDTMWTSWLRPDYSESDTKQLVEDFINELVEYNYTLSKDLGIAHKDIANLSKASHFQLRSLKKWKTRAQTNIEA